MKITLWQRSSIIAKGLLSLGIAMSIFAPVCFLEEKKIIDGIKLDKFFERQIKKKAISFLLQKMWFYSELTIPYIAHFLKEPSYHFEDSLKDLADGSDFEVFASIQRQLFQLNNQAINASLIKNPNLIPELFSELFMEHSTELTPLLQENNFKYLNPQTQARLEKYLLLI